MLIGPEKAISGPNEPPPVKPGHRGQLARLIRERLVFVNLPSHVRRSEVRELHPAGFGPRPRVEKRYSNHKLAGPQRSESCERRPLWWFRNEGPPAAFERVDSRLLPVAKGLRGVFFRGEWR